MTQPIENYALIGDTYTAALVGRDGSIDWLCLPRFDSPACFAALVGEAENGCWKFSPTQTPRSVERRYRHDTLILETTFESASGAATVIDFMSIGDGSTHSLFRIVRGDRGKVELWTELVFRFDYGHVVPWVRRHDYGIRAVAGPDAVRVATPVPLEGRGLTTQATFTVSAGEQVPFVLTWCPSHHDDPPLVDAVAALDATESWWRDWSAQCTDRGEWRDPVVRSLITLKALTYCPTGATVAAPTMSLPEKIGGPRNWDYRYCWLRDAAFTLYALMLSGYRQEAREWRDWLLRAVAGDPASMQIMYGLGGERRIPEIEATWLSGYEGSQPVRIGNAAYCQRQLDVYGEVMDAFQIGRAHGLELDDDTWRVQSKIIEFVEQNWTSEDHGIWETRGPRRHYTYSKVMAWVAVDRAIDAAEKHELEGPLERWRELRETIHAQVCERGFDAARNCFVQYYGATALDASLLLIPAVGFLPADDPRVAGTVDAICRELMVDGFVLRYRPEETPDGLPSDEGTFLVCSFWLADCLAMIGREAEARRLFCRLLDVCNDVGLLAEEYDPRSGRQLGNFPQAYSHVGLINTAHNLGFGVAPSEQRAHQAAQTGGHRHRAKRREKSDAWT